MRLFSANNYLSQILPIQVMEVSANTNTAIHYHDYHELVIITNGNGHHIIGKRQYDMQSGQVFSIPPEVPHGYTGTQNIRLYNVLFDLRRLEYIQAQIAPLTGVQTLLDISTASKNGSGMFIQLEQSELLDIASLIQRMQSELRHDDANGRFQVLGLFIQLLAMLSRFTEQKVSERMPRHIMINTVLAQLEANYQEHITLEQMASAACISVPTLIRYFKSDLGVTPQKYLIDLRTRKAAELLRKTDLSITEVALQTGFYDSTHMAKAFRERYSISPRDYRKE